MQIGYGVKLIFCNKKYLSIFSIFTILFFAVYIFSWNLILLPNFYIRTDLWTPLNILFLTLISFLSGLAVTLSIFSFKTNISSYKSKHGYLAILPSFFISACPSCAPLILSFTATTLTIGLSITQFGIIIKILTILILASIVLYNLSAISKCEIKLKKRDKDAQ